MDLGLAGKVALVTAASEGLGYACATRLAEEGCDVAICGRRGTAVDDARQRLSKIGRQVFATTADIAKTADVERLVSETTSHLGRIDILIVNSGHIDYGGFDNLSDDQWDAAYNLLLMSVVRLTRLCLPSMRKSGGGDIVFLGSATTREPPPHLLLSTVMRLGVAGLAKTLARSLAPENIRVNLVAPGYFDTGRVYKRVREAMADGTSQRDAEVKVSGGLPVGRIGTPEELAALVAFVVSRQAGFMTGSTLAIDGGGTRAL